MRNPTLDNPKPLKRENSPTPRKRSSQKVDYTIIRNRHNSYDNSDGLYHHHHHVSEYNPHINKLLHQNLGPLEMNPVKYAEANAKCPCIACAMENSTKKDVSHIKPHHQQLNENLAFFWNYDFTKDIDSSSGPEKDFVFILKRLIPPRPLPYTLRVFIPETVALMNGEVKFIVMTDKGKKLKFIQDKESLTPGLIRKFFQQHQKVNENDLTGGEEQQEAKTEKKEDDQSSPNGGKKPYLRSKSKAARPRTMITTSQLGKTVSNEMGVIRFKDDTTTIFTDLEFANILLKRKTDNFWKNVQYMQLYLRIRSGISTMQRVYFVYDHEKKDPLFERSRLEIRYLNGEIPKASENYIPLHEEEQFEDELFRTNANRFYLYLLMKIYHFLDIMWHIKIIKMGGDFVKDHLGTPWLINISRLQYECEEPEEIIEPVKEPENITQEEDKEEEGAGKTLAFKAFKKFKIIHKFIKLQPTKTIEENVNGYSFFTNDSEPQNKMFSPQRPSTGKRIPYYSPVRPTTASKAAIAEQHSQFVREINRQMHKAIYMKRGQSIGGEDYTSKGLNFSTDKASRGYLNLSPAEQLGRGPSPNRNDSLGNQSFYLPNTTMNNTRKAYNSFGARSFGQTLTDGDENKDRSKSPFGFRRSRIKRMQTVEVKSGVETESGVPWVQQLNNMIHEKVKLKLNSTFST